MTFQLPASRGAATWLLIGVCGLAACTATENDPVAPGAMQAAKAPAGPSVTATTPPYGNRGENGKQVIITGSAFLAGDQASWQRNGVVDPKIQVLSTQFVNSTTLVATINIAADAELALYDIAIASPGRKGGIGTALFEVTQAVAITGTEIAYGINDNGEAVGRVGVPGAFFWSTLAGLDTLGSPGRAFDISDNGQSVVGGFTFSAPTAEAFIYDLVAGAWQRTLLPKGPQSWATAQAVASDPSTGAAVLIGGGETATNQIPIMWSLVAGAWTRSALPRSAANKNDVVKDVTADGVAVGIIDIDGRAERAAVWEPTGSGGWTLVPIGVAKSKAHGVNSAGTIIVGEQNRAAVYWQRAGSSWGSAILLPGDCDVAMAVDDLGRIAANGCTSKGVPAVFVPPYATATRVLLGGLGDATGSGTIVEGMSRLGGYLVGQARYKSTGVGTIWHIF